MDLIRYLDSHFLTKAELLDKSKLKESELRAFQQLNLMPKCSYQLALSYQCDSFFGEHSEQHKTEYYAKGYTSWIGILKSLKEPQNVYAIFSQRYKDTITSLKEAGFNTKEEKLNAKLDLHIEEEWQHFLSGIYGLCTKSGLPEDIATKELAIAIINETTSLNEEDIDLKHLESAVNLLDEASSLFAPHERLRSSRHRLIDDVRRQFRLKSPDNV